jgi:hypothetical protein
MLSWYTWKELHTNLFGDFFWGGGSVPYLVTETFRCVLYEECRLLEYKIPFHTSHETHYVSTTEPGRLMLCKRFSRQWLWSMSSSGMWCRLDLVTTGVSEEHIASIVRVEGGVPYKSCSYDLHAPGHIREQLSLILFDAPLAMVAHARHSLIWSECRVGLTCNITLVL